MSKKEKLKIIEEEIKKAKEEGNEEYLKYLTRIRKFTVYIEDGGTLNFMSGNPGNPPRPPY